MALRDGAVPFRTPVGAARAGVAFVSNDRKSEGLFLDKTIAWNLVATRLPDLASGGRAAAAARAADGQRLAELVRPEPPTGSANRRSRR